ncbi:DUF3343 domain-containing protein [Helicobacter sp. MIT 14-3879]|uniref:DUF3343 domain-containing protein n=1 Tax=Helicobacter sp. MIT 14-3879 TaxID=2040649 RepID=UPI000E1E6970|nr:DUF3343 domain-containing protein [Helicobacter sp. MIT 14-3879]RDU65211.1 hypothetical protein CQA44_02540 [Helicobacter sp. MIT 14-3879]
MVKGYIIFYTSADVFESESILNLITEVSIKLVSTPRKFSSDCGISIYFECQDNLDIINMALENIEYEIKILD